MWLRFQTDSYTELANRKNRMFWAVLYPIVINAVDLALVKRGMERAVQCLSRFQVARRTLLHDDVAHSACWLAMPLFPGS